MKQLCFLLLMLTVLAKAQAQTRISGTVTAAGRPLSGANILLAGTYDGTSADSTGSFSFTSYESGSFAIVFSSLGYNTDSLRVQLNGQPVTLTLRMKEAIVELNAVTINAGTFETGDNRKGAVLTSIDVATTAGAVADVVAALQTLPGTAQAFGENGLFVRGGTGAETQTFFDGMLVKSAFGSQLPDIAGRSRFSPFLFKGTSFSTGGYSAQYGQALSSALLMESKDMPDKTSTEFSILSVGLSAAHTEKWKKSSLVVGGNYYNLAPMYAVVKQNIDWNRSPVEIQGSAQYKLQVGERGMLKVYSQFNRTRADLTTNFGDEQNRADIVNKNNNYYINATYKDETQSGWKVQGGISAYVNDERGKVNNDKYALDNNQYQARFVLSHPILGRNLVRTGIESSFNSHGESWNALGRSFNNHMQAAFAETEWYLGQLFVTRIGVRTENNSIIDKWNLAPRLSFAMKAGKRGQFALAYGSFYQNPDDAYLVQDRNLDYEKAQHFILNYVYQKTGITFRAETYYKKYDNLTKYNSTTYTQGFAVTNYSDLNNGGSGYAKGFDLFFRDKKTIPGGQYWISYSYLDTKRDFRNYPTRAIPPFAAKHSLNIVYKQYVPGLKTEFGTTYTFSSGRTYYNPNNAVFLGNKTKSFNNLSLNISYLTRVFNEFAVLYASATNLPGFSNVYGYNYSADGLKNTAIRPAANRNYFIGLLVTIGDNTFNH
ncbi:MAG: TonB-dependent receptor [Chitinophagaceae bacterium]|nr:MAG: TonB-dependent receptor [Chitinophagaceae bacterium]